MNRLVEGDERKEAAVAQACQNLLPDDLDPDFDLGFVARAIRPCRHDGGAVMAGEIGIGPVDHRLVKAGPGDAGLQIVAHRLPRRAAEIGKRPNVRGNPVRPALAEAGLGVGVVRGTLIGSDKVEGTAVYGADNQKIGSIERVMIDKVSGRVSYAVLGFGGFLGIGDDHYPLPWQSLKYDTNLGGYRTNVTADKLKGAPKYSNDNSWNWDDPARARAVNDYYSGF